ncbi:hypothetical protein V8E53_008824 [Lactarius tabidus]
MRTLPTSVVSKHTKRVRQCLRVKKISHQGIRERRLRILHGKATRVQEHVETLSDQVECVLHRLFPIFGPQPPALACEATSGGTASEQKVREAIFLGDFRLGGLRCWRTVRSGLTTRSRLERERKRTEVRFWAPWLRTQGPVRQLHHLYPLRACHAVHLTRKPMCVVTNISEDRTGTLFFFVCSGSVDTERRAADSTLVSREIMTNYWSGKRTPKKPRGESRVTREREMIGIDRDVVKGCAFLTALAGTFPTTTPFTENIRPLTATRNIALGSVTVCVDANLNVKEVEYGEFVKTRRRVRGGRAMPL